LQSGGDFLAGDLFCQEKCGGLGPQVVDQRRARSMVDQGLGLEGGSPKLILVAAPVHGGSPWEGENRVGNATRSGSYSPELGRQRDGGTKVVELRLKMEAT
jgi:hypothetical protein